MSMLGTANDDTALLLCATLGDVRCMKGLIANGANVDLKNMHGWSPLSRCARYGHLPAVRVLVEQGAKIDIRLNDGATPLIISVGEQHSGVVRVLLENGADPNRSEEHTSELQSRTNLVCRLLLEKKKY